MTDLSDDLNLFWLFVRVKQMEVEVFADQSFPFVLSLLSSLVSRLSNSCNVTTNDPNGLFEIVFAYLYAAEQKEMQCLRKVPLMVRVSRLELDGQVRRKDDETFLF
jgi:hypothetical protein